MFLRSKFFLPLLRPGVMLSSIILLSLLTVVPSQAQTFDPGVRKRPSYPFRAFLNKFSLNLSTGYGRTFYRHDLSGFGYLRNAQGSFITQGPTSSGTAVGYSNWFSGAEPATTVVGSSDEDFKAISSDEGTIDMQGGGYSIPLNLSLYFNLYRFRVGGGAMLDFHRANVPQPDNFLTPFPEPDHVRSTMFRYYFLLGYSFYEYYDNAFGVDVRVGKVNMGGGFDDAVIKPSPFVNVGVTFEKVFSEYFRIYARPAYEFKSYELTLPDATIDHRNNAAFLTVGVSINYPDMPRSPIKNDKTQMKHYVSDPMGNRKEFRGQPFWRKQDPKIGELYPELNKTRRKRQAKRKDLLRKKD